MTDTFNNDTGANDQAVPGDARDDMVDLAAVYALGAVDDAERREVERRLADDEQLSREVDSFRAVVAAFTADQAPPPALKSAVLAEIKDRKASPQGERDDAEPTEDERPATSSSRKLENRTLARGTRWAITAIAMVSVVGIATSAVLAINARTEQERMASDVAMITDMIADPHTQIMSAPVDGGGMLRVLAASNNVMVTATGLEPLDPSKDYQLWLIKGDQISSAGVMSPTDGSASMMLPDAGGMTIAMTIEPSGGSGNPTTPPVAMVKT